MQKYLTPREQRMLNGEHIPPSYIEGVLRSIQQRVGISSDEAIVYFNDSPEGKAFLNREGYHRPDGIRGYEKWLKKNRKRTEMKRT